MPDGMHTANAATVRERMGVREPVGMAHCSTLIAKINSQVPCTCHLCYNTFRVFGNHSPCLAVCFMNAARQV